MRNYNYEYQISAEGRNFFHPLGWYEETPAYALTNTADYEANTFLVPVSPPARAASLEVNQQVWQAAAESYDEAGGQAATAGDGGMLKQSYSSSFSDSVSSSSFSSSTHVSFVATSFSVSVTYNSNTGKGSAFSVALTHDRQSITTYSHDYFVSLGSKSKLTYGFTSRGFEFFFIERAPFLQQVFSLLSSDSTTSATNVSVYNVSYPSPYHSFVYMIPQFASRVTTIQWGDFTLVHGTQHTISSVICPFTRFSREPIKIDYGALASSTLSLSFPGNSKESLTILTTTGTLLRVVTTTATTGNTVTETMAVQGSVRPITAITTFWTGVSSKHLLTGSTKNSVVNLRVPIASFSTANSFEEFIPEISTIGVSVNGISTFNFTRRGFKVVTFAEQIYQQRLWIHSHFGAECHQYGAIVGFAPFLKTFTSTSPIYQTLSTKLVSAISGSTFKGYFPYQASIIPNVVQMVTQDRGSHALIVHVTERSSFKSSTSITAIVNVVTIASDGTSSFTRRTTASGSRETFYTVSSFSTTYLDTVLYKTSALSSDGGLFTLSRIDFKNSTRKQVMSLKLLNGIFGTNRLNVGGFGLATDAPPLLGANVFAVGGVNYAMKLLGANNPLTIVLNWGYWFGTNYQQNSAEGGEVEINQPVHRLLRGEASQFQTSFTLAQLMRAFFTHREQFRMEILNESYQDFGTINYFRIESQTKKLRNLSSSPLYPARHLDFSSTQNGVFEI